MATNTAVDKVIRELAALEDPHGRRVPPVTISGHPGNDAKPYQVKDVRLAIRESRR
jgi:hypothetical protein